MPVIRLNSYPPHKAQMDVLGCIRAHSGEDGILRCIAKAGRGGGKTALGALAIFESMTTFNRGLAHIWTEQDDDDCRTVFLPVWEALIPSRLYTMTQKPMTIRLAKRIGGARLDVRSRYARSPKERRGGTYAGAVTDESAQDRSGQPTLLIEKMLREPKARNLWHLITTTPKPGWFNEMVRVSSDPVFTWSSWDNTHIKGAVFDDFCKDMTPEQIRGEMHGECVSMTGMVWSEFVDKPWPDGNRHDARHRPGQPYELWADIGLRGAWLIVQQVDIPGTWEHIDVIVAEYQPNDGDTHQMIQRITGDYGPPAAVYGGGDISWSHKSVQTGTPEAVLFRQAWPNARLGWPTGMNVTKERQVWNAKARICHPRTLERRLCVSMGLKSHNPSLRRGVLELFASDTWPDVGEPGAAGLLRKDKARNPNSVEDTRDAVLYGVVCSHPPRVGDPSWRRQ